MFSYPRRWLDSILHDPSAITLFIVSDIQGSIQSLATHADTHVSYAFSMMNVNTLKMYQW